MIIVLYASREQQAAFGTHKHTLAFISLLTASIKFQWFRCSVSCVDELVTIASCGCVHAPYLIDKDTRAGTALRAYAECRCVPSILCVTITYAEIVITYKLNELTNEWSEQASERSNECGTTCNAQMVKLWWNVAFTKLCLTLYYLLAGWC